MSGIFDEVVEYGPGGYDPAKPDGNVARRIRKEVPVRVANERTARDRAAAALVDNKTFLALANPSAAQTAAQVKKLTRQTNALIRILLSEHSDATDT